MPEIGRSDTDGHHEREYDAFAGLYSALTRATGRTESEALLIERLLDRAAIGRTGRILDLGCGPGSVLASLIRSGYVDVTGIDISSQMIKEARLQAPEATFVRGSWNELGILFSAAPNFRFVYSLSQTITHAHEADLPGLLEDTHGLLDVGGIFVMDVRQWTVAPDGTRYEPHRPPGTWRVLPSITTDSCCIWIDDRCRYDGTRQIVEYRMRKRAVSAQSEPGETHLAVSYNTLTHLEYHELLTQAGFRNVESQLHHDWPYIVVIAER